MNFAVLEQRTRDTIINSRNRNSHRWTANRFRNDRKSRLEDQDAEIDQGLELTVDTTTRSFCWASNVSNTVLESPAMHVRAALRTCRH
jgi:hypothetical protein